MAGLGKARFGKPGQGKVRHGLADTAPPAAFVFPNLGGHYMVNWQSRQGASEMLKVDIEREDDGRWIGEVPDLPGVLVCAGSPHEAYSRAMALAFRVLADRIEHDEPVPSEVRDIFAAA